MGAHRRLRLGDKLASLTVYLAGLLALHVLSPLPRHAGAWALTGLLAGLVGAFVIALMVHELGHVAAVRLAGRWPTAVHLFGPPDRITFHVGAVRIGLGIRPGGEVEYTGMGLSATQYAAIAAAGSVADLVIAPLALLLPVPRWAAVYLAVMVAATGLANLIPARTDNGSLSDGGTLLRTRARVRAAADIRELLAAADWSSRPDAASLLISGWVLDVPAAEERLRQLPAARDALLRLYAQDWLLPKRPEREFLNIVHALSWKVVAKPDLPAGLADLAAARVEWVLGHAGRDGDDQRPRPCDVRHTLAVVRLRQGHPAEVRTLCADALAASQDRDDRATVLATVAMARHQLCLLASARQALDEALALDPEADLVAEALGLLSTGPPVLTARPPGS